MTLHRSSRSGFTLVEALVVVSIIGLLAALLVPAVISSRESSRNVECSNRLRQIGVAMASHESAHGFFPPGMRPSGVDAMGRRFANSPLSAHYQLLPYLEQTPLFNSINVRPGSIDAPVGVSSADATAAKTSLAVFLCPSDPSDLRPGNSYRANFGAHPYEFEHAPGLGLGSFTGFDTLKPADFADGLGSTAAFSERVMGSGRKDGQDRQRDIWFSGLANQIPRPTPDQVREKCGLPSHGPRETWSRAGEHWIVGRYADTMYNHVSNPNWDGMDCSVDIPFGEPGDLAGGAVSARSNHHHFVNTLFMDGSVRRITSTVDLMIWRSMGTRAGREPASPE